MFTTKSNRRPFSASIGSLAVYAGILLFGSATQAQHFVVQTETIPSTQFSFPLNTVGTGGADPQSATQFQSTNTSASFQAFDTSLGHLDAVYVRLSGSASGEMGAQVFQFGTPSQVIGLNAQMDHQFSVTAPGFSSVTLTLSPNGGAGHDLTASHTSDDFTLAQQLGNTGFLGATDLTAYSGNGPVQINWNLSITAQATVSNGSIFYQLGDTYGGEVDLAYQYTPVPEPSVAGMLLLFAAVGAGVHRYGRQKKAAAVA